MSLNPLLRLMHARAQVARFPSDLTHTPQRAPHRDVINGVSSQCIHMTLAVTFCIYHLSLLLLTQHDLGYSSILLDINHDHDALPSCVPATPVLVFIAAIILKSAPSMMRDGATNHHFVALTTRQHTHTHTHIWDAH